MLFLANIFQPLIDIFEPALKFFHSNLGVSWGWSIVLLTVVIRALLLPLAFRQFHSMQKLQQAAPELKAIQAKYKEDKQRQQQEVMKFYRENEINPFASCLPLVAQLPVFIGLFYTLRTRLRQDICPTVQTAFQQHYATVHHITTKAAAGQATSCGPGHGAGFLFINDITSTATGVTLVILIVLYVGTQLASTLMMSTPTMDPNQRRIMMLMPLFFVIFIINFPSGLIVYWITTNAWTMLQQYVIRRRIGPVVPVSTGDATAPGKPPPDGKARPEPPTNGDGGGGLGGLLRGLSKQDEPKEPTGVAAGPRARRETPPPRPPRKKKKRSGRRR
jgi:YidC/Oxa1 family membrane protein insertase